MERLHGATRHILEAFPVRKTKRQKEAFRGALVQALEDAGWAAEVQCEPGLAKSHNVVAGQVKGAHLVLSAHYDTPARLPFPNFMAPQNLLLSLLYQLLLAVLLCLPVFAVSFGGRLLGLPPPAAMAAGLGVLVAMLFLLLAGPANPHNANDNTSGVLAVLEAAHALPPELRGGVALVFFDNEEKGLLGSAAFRARHGALEDTLLLNFDCVGDGDELLMVLPKALRGDKATAGLLGDAFPPAGAKQVTLDASRWTLYPSDQMHFKRGVGVAACRRAKGVGLYLARIHTPRDVVLDAANIVLLREGVVRLAGALAAGDDKGGQ